MAMITRPRMASERAGRAVVFTGLLVVDIEAESRHQLTVCRKARRFARVVFVLCGNIPAL